MRRPKPGRNFIHTFDRNNLKKEIRRKVGSKTGQPVGQDTNPNNIPTQNGDRSHEATRAAPCGRACSRHSLARDLACGARRVRAVCWSRFYARQADTNNAPEALRRFGVEDLKLRRVVQSWVLPDSMAMPIWQCPAVRENRALSESGSCGVSVSPRTGLPPGRRKVAAS